MEENSREFAEQGNEICAKARKPQPVRNGRQKPASYYSSHERDKSCHFNGRNPLAAIGQTGQNPVVPQSQPAVQEAVAEKISRMDKSALARECAKLDRNSEQAMADEGLATYCRLD